MNYQSALIDRWGVVVPIDPPASSAPHSARPPQHPSHVGKDFVRKWELPASSLEVAMHALLSAIRSATGLGEASVYNASAGAFADWELDILHREKIRRHAATIPMLLQRIRAMEDNGMHLRRDKVDLVSPLQDLYSLFQELEERTDQGAAYQFLQLEYVARASELAQSILSASTLRRLPHFPLEHLAAVYLPAWLPIALPLVLGLAREVKLAWRSNVPS